MAKVVKSFSLDTQRDANLITFIEALPRGELSQLIRDLLRGHVEGRRDLDLCDVLQAITRLERKIEAGTPVAVRTQAPQPEPHGDAPGTEQAARNLDRLGL